MKTTVAVNRVQCGRVWINAHGDKGFSFVPTDLFLLTKLLMNAHSHYFEAQK